MGLWRNPAAHSHGMGGVRVQRQANLGKLFKWGIRFTQPHDISKIGHLD